MRIRWPGIARVLTYIDLSGIACSGLTTVCTLLGCESGVTVHLASLPGGPFRVEVRPRGAGDAVYVFECNVGASCRQVVFFAGLITDYLVVTVKVAGAVRDTEITQVTYVSHRPNGPNCEPDCRTASVIAQVPA
jgi:hypothetical protein